MTDLRVVVRDVDEWFGRTTTDGLSPVNYYVVNCVNYYLEHQCVCAFSDMPSYDELLVAVKEMQYNMHRHRQEWLDNGNPRR